MQPEGQIYGQSSVSQGFAQRPNGFEQGLHRQGTEEFIREVTIFEHGTEDLDHNKVKFPAPIPHPPHIATAPVFMSRPPQIAGVSFGLEYLMQLDCLQVQQLPNILEAMSGYEQNNKYIISNSAGHQIYFAFESSGACMRMCCGTKRSFVINVLDNQNQEILRVKREFKCCAGCCWCAGCCNSCSNELIVETPNGTPIGYIKQKGSICTAHYDVLDEHRQAVLKIIGPCCICDGVIGFCDNQFKLMTLNETEQIGSLTKLFGGIVNEVVTNADRFRIDFPVDLAVKVKATLIGAMFLIDFMFYEQMPSND